MALWHSIQGLVQRLERRSISPSFAGDEILLVWGSGQNQVGRAVVLDWTMHGLRVRHNLPITTDDSVSVITPGWSAQARVIWSERFANVRESVLLLVGEAANRATVATRAA